MPQYVLGTQLDPNAQQKYQQSLQTQLVDLANQQAQSQKGGGLLDGLFSRIGSIGNALSTTAAAAASPFVTAANVMKMNQTMADNRAQNEAIVKKYGFQSYDDYLNADQSELDNSKYDQMFEELKGASANQSAKVNQIANDYKNNIVTQKIDNTDRYKFAGDAIQTLSTAADVLLPGVMATPLANGIQGGIEGFAQELSENGENYNLENALRNAAVGSVSGAVTGGIGNKLKAPTGVLGSIARGAELGGLGGAVSGGLNTALNQSTDLGDIANGALQGALQGAKSGAATGAVMPVVNKVASKTPGIGKLQQGIQEANADVMENGVRGSFKRAAESGNSAVYNNVIEPTAQGFKNVGEGTAILAKRGVNAIQDKIADWRAGDDQGFGPQYNQYAGDPEGAVNYLMRRQQGEVPGAAYSQALQDRNGDGFVDLVYGENGKSGYGLAHIAEKHGENALGAIPGTLENGSVVESPRLTNDKRTTLYDGNATAGVRSDWNGHKKQWLATTFEGEPNTPASTSASSGGTARDSFGRSVNDAPIDTSVSQQGQNVNSVYGESQLANQTKRGSVADRLRQVGETMEGAQANVTRAAARDLGIESTGKSIEKVRSKTGLTNLETQAQFAKELTGGENSLMDSVQRQALATDANGKPFRVDTSNVSQKIESIVSKYADDNTFGSQKARARFVENLQRSIRNDGSDVLTISNRLKSQAAELRGKGITSPTPKDAAAAKIYTDVAKQLDDLSYSAIPQSNVDAMFDTTIAEMRDRAQQAAQNGNKNIAKAYNTAADRLDAEPRTVKTFRSFKKDFVDVSKIDTLTAQAENGAGLKLGQSAKGMLKQGVDTILQKPVQNGLARAGGVVNDVASKIDGSSGGTNPTGNGGRNFFSDALGIPMTFVSPENVANSWNQTRAVIDSSPEVINSDGMTRQAQEDEYQSKRQPLEQALADIDEINAFLAQSQASESQAVMSQAASQMQQAQDAMSRALAAGDLQSYNYLYSNVYQPAAAMYSAEQKTQESSLNTSEKNQLAKLQTASNAIDELESLFNKAGGGQGVVGGNFQNFLGSIGLNSDVSTYNQLAQGLINQIGAAIGKTDSLNTEGEVQRALELVPRITDDAQTAQNKLTELRRLLGTNQQSYASVYGITQ